VNSILQPQTGQVASAFATFVLPGGTASSLQFSFETNTSFPVQALFFVYNYSSGKYDNFGSASQSTTDKITDFQVSNAAPYIGPGGTVKMLIRAVNPTRSNRNAPPTTLKVDQVSLTPG
jgi:hypothetical protein